MRTNRLWELLTRGALVAVYRDLIAQLETDETEPRDEKNFRDLIDEIEAAAIDNYGVDIFRVASDWYTSQRDEMSHSPARVNPCRPWPRPASCRKRG